MGCLRTIVAPFAINEIEFDGTVVRTDGPRGQRSWSKGDLVNASIVWPTGGQGGGGHHKRVDGVTPPPLRGVYGGARFRFIRGIGALCESVTEIRDFS
ncbi:hypothetical protein JTE90_016044 [Oedothorax gibbosus]|uniref:Uncharacterized protein n=1 Tax=Oedothorax gibbosus TaxID=931172 RepID=A0AAV6U5A6_9ARAC|nr:hypothetical protein JTE90_016044 [Oedothorax gibbosus]